VRFRNCAVIGLVALVVTAGWAESSGGEDVAVREEGSFPHLFLGGGEYVMARAPAGDSWMAVVFGTGNQTVRSPITLVASWNRTIAGAEVHDAAGKLTNRSRPVTVRALLVHRLASIIEFNDSNGDGIGGVAVSDAPVAGDQLLASEPVHKAVSLRQYWTRGPVEESTRTENGTAVKDIAFDLSASDLDYIVVGNRSSTNASPGDGRLNLLRFSFHIRVFSKSSTVGVPFYNVSLPAAGAQPAAAARLPDRTFNMTTWSARVKVDHLIEGWDFDPANGMPRLLLESGTSFTWAAAPSAAPWMDAAFVQKTLGGGGTASYQEDSGQEVTASAADEGLRPGEAPPEAKEMPRKAAERELRLEDNWERCGWLTWTSDVGLFENASAPASTGRAFFQVQGARRASIATDRGTYAGLLLLGGLSYPGAWRVVHDPELGVDMGNVDIPWFGPPENHPPVAHISSPTEGKEYRASDSIRLDGTACSDADGDPLSYSWTEGTKLLGNSSIISRKFSEGRHRVSLTIHDGRGGYDSASVNFTVKKESTPGSGPAATALAFLFAAALAAAWRRRS